jgi:nitroimidazol reductase NimA-like FMN-containing flavoprotein (pyridoxamine 5'-phosphate oxidase superfamily)
MMMTEAGNNERKALIEAILAEPVLARLATSNPKTMQPHVVPVWFLWDGEFIWVSSFVNTRKISELKNNPRGAI